MVQTAADTTELVVIFERTGFTALIAAGLIEFVPPLLLLLVHSAELPVVIWLTWLAPVLIFGSGYLPPLRPYAAVIQATAGLLFLLCAIVFPQSHGPGWVTLPFSAFAVAFGAAFTMSVVPALVTIAAAAALNFVAVVHPTPQMILAAADLAGGTVGPVFILIAAPALLGMAYEWRRAARIADASLAEVGAAAASSYRAVQVQSARTAVDRRIHETVLNTLNAISQDIGQQGDLLRAECRRDIEQLQLGAVPVQESTLGALVAEARSVAGLQTPRVVTAVDTGYLLPQQSAGALRDALVEALRNVERHAQATAVEIRSAQSAGMLEVTVSDDGRGLREGDTERFGLRNTIRASLAAVGGAAVVEGAPGGGTTVRMRVPIVIAAELHVPVSPILDVLLDSVRSRVLLIAPAIFGLVMLPWMAAGLGETSYSFAVGFLAFFGCNLALATLWGTRWRVPLTLFALVAGLVTYAITQPGVAGCSAASSLHWIINSVAGGIALMLFAGQRYWWHWWILPSVTAAGVALTLQLPEACRAVPAMSLVVTVVYMSAALFLMTVLFREFDRRRSDSLLLWATSVEHQAEIERQITVTSQWSKISASTVALLRDIADGRVQASDAVVRERAASEESQLRGNLGMERRSTSSIWRVVLDAVELGAAAGLSVDAAVITMPEDSAPIPDEVRNLLATIVTTAPSRTVTMRLFVDEGCAEVLVTGPDMSVQHAWSRLVATLGLTTERAAGSLRLSHVVMTLTDTGESRCLVSIRLLPETAYGY